MFRRTLFLGLSVVILAAALATSGIWITSREDAAADGERTIPVHIMSYRDNDDGKLKEGDPCSWHLGTIDILWADPQLVVRDESGTVVAMQTLDNGTIRLGELEGSAFCEMDVQMTVPDAAFYTLYFASLEEIRIMGYSASAFPIDEIPITIDPDLNGLNE
jgi:hypothetical protein